MGICGVCRRRIWASVSESHIHLLSDPKGKVQSTAELPAFPLDSIQCETCFSHRIPLFKAVGFSCLPRGPSDSKIFDEIVAELIRRKILRKGDFFVLNKGFYAYKHYIDGLLRYGIVPLVFPRKNFKLEKVLNSILLTLDFFNDRAYRIKKKIQQLKTILKEFKHNILNWKLFKPKRSLIEDVFKVIKGP